MAPARNHLESAQELMTPQVKAMVEKALAYLKTSPKRWSNSRPASPITRV